MLSGFDIRACQAEAFREGMAYLIFIESFLVLAFNNSIFSFITWLGSDTLWQALELGGKRGLHNGWRCWVAYFFQPKSQPTDSLRHERENRRKPQIHVEFCT